MCLLLQIKRESQRTSLPSRKSPWKEKTPRTSYGGAGSGTGGSNGGAGDFNCNEYFHMMTMQRQEDQDRQEEQHENKRQWPEDDHELRLHKQKDGEHTLPNNAKYDYDVNDTWSESICKSNGCSTTHEYFESNDDMAGTEF